MVDSVGDSIKKLPVELTRSKLRELGAKYIRGFPNYLELVVDGGESVRYETKDPREEDSDDRLYVRKEIQS